jgi:hypothetical protein
MIKLKLNGQMNKPTEKQIKAKIKSLDNQRYKLGKESNNLQQELQKRSADKEAQRLLKIKFIKTQYGDNTEVVYIHEIKVNKKDPLHSKTKGVRVFRDNISHIDVPLHHFSYHKLAKQDDFVKAFSTIIKEIDLRLPLIKKTKVGL